MPTLAPHSFWLDGSYDRDSVEACPYHPEHKWWEFRLGDVIEPAGLVDPDEHMVICQGCYVPRCGHTTDDDPCVLPRHHDKPHQPQSGRPLCDTCGQPTLRVERTWLREHMLEQPGGPKVWVPHDNAVCRRGHRTAVDVPTEENP